MGVIKSAEEIVRKSVETNVRRGKLAWMDKKKTLVGLPEWSGKKK